MNKMQEKKVKKKRSKFDNMEKWLGKLQYQFEQISKSF